MIDGYPFIRRIASPLRCASIDPIWWNTSIVSLPNTDNKFPVGKHVYLQLEMSLYHQSGDISMSTYLQNAPCIFATTSKDI